MDLQKRQWTESQTKGMGFVTVVSVGTENAVPESGLQNKKNETAHPGYVTILAVGEIGSAEATEEEVLIYRLPGERLGFGLKFEGGTKAVEYVKRLFIQSCAPDSPASRVRSSWGKLIEGDEIIEIDLRPINQMTRLDCVKCLKDSNVIIKLLVRHVNAKNEFAPLSSECGETNGGETKVNYNTPPPVPPRKIPRKLPRESSASNVIVPDTRPESVLTRHEELRKSGNNRLQSPRNSVKYNMSNRDGSAGPPDAEIYIDLFSQESTCSLSESDETGSSISTVVDRLSSYPTTSNSSFAGSGPSTPTANPKILNLTNVISDMNDVDFDASEAFFNALIPSAECFEDPKCYEPRTTKNNNSSILLQPASNFQDAQLSYGNEDVKMMETSFKLLLSQTEKESVGENNPPLPPRRLKSPPTCCPLEKNNNVCLANSNYDHTNDRPDDDKIETVLPRLVDFVPKSLPCAENLGVNKKIIQLFIDNEKRLSNELSEFYWQYQNSKGAIDNADLQNWSTSSQLSTIGEDDEEASIDGSLPIVPIVTVENADDDGEKSDGGSSGRNNTNADDMDCPPSYSRQPPDGHEFPFPNYQEVLPPVKQNCAPKGNMDSENFASAKDNRVIIYDKVDVFSNEFLNQTEEARLNFNSDDRSFSRKNASPHPVHVRSQSLVDISTTSKRDNWNLLLEQRRRGLSKLKGLVIPESTAETQVTVDIPELKIDVPNISLKEGGSKDDKIGPKISSHSSTLSATPCLSTPPWSLPNTTSVPKYSPAFKRKSLQVYGTTQKPAAKHYLKLQEDAAKNAEDPSKSLESIASPTQSDYDFDYATLDSQISKKEEESDNDSALSSNQSNVSKNSPPVSPSVCDTFNSFSSSEENKQENRRLLKPRSVEAINRKNILASAKCRSGSDVKVIRQKYEEKSANSMFNNKKLVSLPPKNLDKTTSFPSKIVPPKAFVKKIDLVDKKVVENGKPLRSSYANNSSPAVAPKGDEIMSNIKKLRKTFENLPNKVQTLHINTFVAKKSEVKENNEPIKNFVNVDELIKELGENIKRSDVKVISLKPEITGGSVGITLAGGTDYEVKDITVHKVRNGSIACKDGRLKKGDRILSINGRSMKALTHEQAVAILKEPVPLVTVVACALQSEVIAESPQKSPRVSAPKVNKGNIKTITLKKDSAGLGFSMDGGRDSLEGDKPLLIKKIFKGGSAEKCGLLQPGDELLAINDVNLTNATKVDAWSLMKKLPEGDVFLNIRR